MKTSPAIVILLIVVHGLVACGSRSSSTLPAGPSPVIAAPAPVPAPAGQRVFGYVSDTAYRPVADVRVEVLDGPLAGQTLTTASDGIFNYPGTLTGIVTFRATKAGYVTATESSRSNGGGTSLVLFRLDVDTPPVQIAGDYSMTFVADAACADRLPKDVPPLTYDATIARQPGVAGTFDTQYTLTARSANMLAVDSFPVGVAGTTVMLSLYHGEDAGLIERLSPTRYLALYGQAETAVTTLPSIISAPFNGSIDYCGVIEPGQPHDACWSPTTSTHIECTSKNNRVILTRR